ncbi:MAG: hypothetical protein D6722_10525, partial [Bacteroidetes bacterium]
AIAAGWLAEQLSRLTGRDLPLTLENMRSGTQSHRYDGSKIEALGFRYTPIETVIAETARAYQARQA